MKKVGPLAESEIRDHLAENLDLIEDGLVLINKEEYLPNDKGAAGFMDIFARSKAGQLVIIEIKRSDAAARQAIQELVKYAALLKTKKLIKETEYRMLVLSTDWHELRVPFSEFVHTTKYLCEGKKIIAGENGLTSTTEDVPPLPPTETRKFSGRHFIWEFQNEQSAKKSIQIIADYMKEVGIKDFILATISLNVPVEKCSNLIYFAHQQKSLDEYREIIKNRFSTEEVEEFEEWLSDLSEMEDKIEEAADKAWDQPWEEEGLYARIRSVCKVSCQISHPEKARYWFSEARAQEVEISRYGRFEDPTITNETIINELVGEGGHSNFRLNLSASLKSKPEIDAFLAASDNIFYSNFTWKAAIRDLCGYAQETGATSISIKAFNNDDIIAAISGLAINYPYWTPTFNFEVTKDGQKEFFVGVIEWNGQIPDFEEIINEYFDGDAFNYLLHRHFGTQRALNADLMEEMGLSYCIAQVSDDQSEKVRVRGASVLPVKNNKKKSLHHFLEKNEEFIRKIINLRLEGDMAYGTIFNSQIENHFAKG